MTYEREYWQVGTLLSTNMTRRMSKSLMDKLQAEEERRVYKYFRARDKGRSRELVGEFVSKEYAQRAVEDHNREEDIIYEASKTKT